MTSIIKFIVSFGSLFNYTNNYWYFEKFMAQLLKCSPSPMETLEMNIRYDFYEVLIRISFVVKMINFVRESIIDA